MKNVSSLKSNETKSPKTPGGISKSLLTPCRRLGLSRNWKKSGPSPFISPLAGSSTEVIEEKNVTRKRKDRLLNENIKQTENTSPGNENEVEVNNIDHTPSRNIEEPCKKKSKILLKSINKPQEQDVISGKCTEEQALEETAPIDGNIENTEVVSTPVRTKSNKKRPSPLKSRDTEQTVQETVTTYGSIAENTEAVSTPVRAKSIRIKKRLSPLKSRDKEANKKLTEDHDESTATVEVNPNEATYKIKERSPNDLKKECVVVIQRKIFKNVEKKEKAINIKDEKPLETVESDSDDTPLISIQNQNSMISNAKVIMNDDDDFIENTSSKAKIHKPKDLKSPKNRNKTSKPAKTKIVKAVVDDKPSSQDCFDDDDDDFDNKKTILIRKTYEKVSKPLKAKSTGSITQRDIDNLKHRIEVKKKLLLAQSLTPDTEDLRNLIKKWQKGCQDALMELLELMRNKFPGKERMDYSEMLQTLKIPPSLVGYDSENDCFNSPDDASIILGQYKDL